MPHPRAMRNLYQRLDRAGFSAPFVRKTVLPDWWNDAMADDPGNQQFAQALIARQLRLTFSSVAQDDAVLEHVPGPSAKLKTRVGTKADQASAAVEISRRVAELVALAYSPERTKVATPIARDAATLRTKILATGAFVTLRTLLDLAAEHGIPVVHVHGRPGQGRKIDGLATTVGGRHVIVLSSGYDAPGKIAFHLGHELGHIAGGHLEESCEKIEPAGDGAARESGPEAVANAFATELLTGNQDLPISLSSYSGLELSQQAMRWGYENRVDPAAAVCRYGWRRGRHDVAGSALRSLHEASGAHVAIRERLKEQLDLSLLPEDDRRFLQLLCFGVVKNSPQKRPRRSLARR